MSYQRTMKSLFRGGQHLNCQEDKELYHEIATIDQTSGLVPLYSAMGGIDGLTIRERDILFTVEPDPTLPRQTKVAKSRYENFSTPGTDNYSKVSVFGSLNGLQQVVSGKMNMEEARERLHARIKFHSISMKNISSDGTTTGFVGGTCSLVNNTRFPWKSQRLGMLALPHQEDIVEQHKYADQRDVISKRIVPIIVPINRTSGTMRSLFSSYNFDVHAKAASKRLAKPVLQELGVVVDEVRGDNSLAALDPNARVDALIARKSNAVEALLTAIDMYAQERLEMASLRFESDVGPGRAGVVKIFA